MNTPYWILLKHVSEIHDFRISYHTGIHAFKDTSGPFEHRIIIRHPLHPDCDFVQTNYLQDDEDRREELAKEILTTSFERTVIFPFFDTTPPSEEKLTES